MIIEVDVEGEESPRRYRVRRDRGTIRMWRLGATNEHDDASSIEIDWRMPESGNYSLLVEGRSYDVHVGAVAADPELLELHVLNQMVRARASDARRHRVVPISADADGTVSIAAPMPGRVVDVLASQGTAVRRGDGIIVLEAMKMENELKAPRDGTVVKILVEQGEGVEGGAILAIIE